LGNLGTLGFRQEVWRWSLVAIEDFPFTGTGLGAFRRVVHRLYPITVPATYDIAHAHNIFLQVALDLGLPGLVAYLGLLALALRMGWQAARRDAAARPWAWGLLAGLLALHAYGLADALAPGSKPALLFWLALGLLCAMARLAQSRDVDPPEIRESAVSHV
jgi:putative inorganic carbon (HCO3(-)) transporter